MQPSSFFVTDKFQSFLYRFIGSLIAFGLVDNLNLADPNTWQTQSGRALSILAASFFIAAVDYAQNMRGPVGTNPTHDGNA